MHDHEDALREVLHQVYRNTDDFEMRISKDCYKLIREALEKQIPKKPVVVGEEYIFERDEWEKDYECPFCGNPYADDLFCSCCDQKLDWSDTE